MKKVNIQQKLNEIKDYWNPRVVGELNGQQVRLVKIKGSDFEMHQHPDEEEMFFVIKGTIELDFGEEKVQLNEGEFFIVPRGKMHRPIAKEEASLMMFVTKNNVNTGDVENDFTLDTNKLERL